VTGAESKLGLGVIWVGTDDGLVQLTRDGGQNWQNITPKGIPEWIRINSLEVSPHDKATCYIAATMYQFDDDRPYLYKTNDYGRTWTKIVRGIPEHVFTRVIREDPTRRGLLYTGTETGLYVSFDDGANWQPFQLNRPAARIAEPVDKDKDHGVETKGGPFWILDALPQFIDYKDSVGSDRLHVFAPRPSVRFSSEDGPDGDDAPPRAVGKNPPDGVLV